MSRFIEKEIGLIGRLCLRGITEIGRCIGEDTSWKVPQIVHEIHRGNTKE